MSPPFLNNKHPISLLRQTTFAIIGAGMAAWAAVEVGGYIDLVVTAAAGAAAAGGAAGNTGAAVVDLAARRAAIAHAKARALVSAKNLAKVAAGVIGAVGSLEKDAKAAAPNDVNVRDVRPVAILPIEVFKSRGGLPTFSTRG